MSLSSGVALSALSLVLALPALAQPFDPETAPYPEAHAYAQRGVVLSPRALRVGLTGTVTDRTIRSSYHQGTTKETTTSSAAYADWGISFAWSPLQDVEFGSDILGFRFRGGTDTDFLSSLWARARLFQEGAFDLGLGLSLRSHLALELPMRYHLSPCTHLAFTPSYRVPIDSEDHNHLLNGDRHRLNLYLGVAHNFLPSLYGVLAFDSLMDLQRGDHQWGGLAALGYSFGREGAAFIDLELNARLKYLPEDTFNGLDSITWLQLGLALRAYF